MLDHLRGLGELTLRGLVSTNAPTIFKGMINEMFRQNGTSVKKVIPMVQENKSLWGVLPPDYPAMLKRAASQAGDMEWLTPEWIIDAIKKDHPALASLFLSWRKSRTWLGRQIKEIKGEVLET